MGKRCLLFSSATCNETIMKSPLSLSAGKVKFFNKVKFCELSDKCRVSYAGKKQKYGAFNAPHGGGVDGEAKIQGGILASKKKTKSLTRSLSFKIMETDKMLPTCISQLQVAFI